MTCAPSGSFRIPSPPRSSGASLQVCSASSGAVPAFPCRDMGPGPQSRCLHRAARLLSGLASPRDTPHHPPQARRHVSRAHMQVRGTPAIPTPGPGTKHAAALAQERTTPPAQLQWHTDLALGSTSPPTGPPCGTPIDSLRHDPAAQTKAACLGNRPGRLGPRPRAALIVSRGPITIHHHRSMQPARGRLGRDSMGWSHLPPTHPSLSQA